MMCARLLRPAARRAARAPRRAGPSAPSARCCAATAAASRWGLRHGRARRCWCCSSTVCLNVYLYVSSRRASSRSRTPGAWSAASRPTRASRSRRCSGSSTEFMTHRAAATRRSRTSSASPAAPQRNSGFMFVALKPLVRAQAVGRPGHRPAARQARQGARREPVPAAGAGHPHRRPPERRAVPVHAAGATISPSSARGSPGSAQALSQLPELADVNTDQQDKGLQTSLVIDRDAASRLGRDARA